MRGSGVGRGIDKGLVIHSDSWTLKALIVLGCFVNCLLDLFFISSCQRYELYDLLELCALVLPGGYVSLRRSRRMFS